MISFINEMFHLTDLMVFVFHTILVNHYTVDYRLQGSAVIEILKPACLLATIIPQDHIFMLALPVALHLYLYDFTHFTALT